MMPSSKKDAFIVFLLLAFIYVYFYQDHTWNGNSRFSLIFAIVEQGQLRIDDYFEKPGTTTGDISYYQGHYYSDKAIGPAVAGVIYYLPLYRLFQGIKTLEVDVLKAILNFLVIGIPSAITGSLIYTVCAHISRNRFKSYLITCGITLGTLYLPYSVAFFSHQFTSSLLFTTFYLIFIIKEKSKKPRGSHLFLIGFLSGWAVISEYPAVIIAAVLISYYLLVQREQKELTRLRTILLPVLGGIIPISLQLVYNWLCFGSVISTGYTNLVDTYFRLGMSKGVGGIGMPSLKVLFYMTLHPTVGLLWQSPFLLLSFIGTGYALINQKYKLEGIIALVITCSYIIVFSGYFMWWGGSALGVRHIIPILPYFCFLLICLPKIFTWPLAGLGLISIGQMFIGVATNISVPETMVRKINTLGYFEYSHIYDYGLQKLMDGKFGANFGNFILGMESWYSLLPLLAIIVVITSYFFIFPPKTTQLLIINSEDAVNY